MPRCPVFPFLLLAFPLAPDDDLNMLTLRVANIELPGYRAAPAVSSLACSSYFQVNEPRVLRTPYGSAIIDSIPSKFYLRLG